MWLLAVTVHKAKILSMLSTGCHCVVPKHPSRTTSSLPYKRRGYSEKPWGDINTKYLFPPFIKGSKPLTIVSVLSYCPLKSLTALHLHTHAGSRLVLSHRRLSIPRPRLHSQWWERVPGWASLHCCVAAHRDRQQTRASMYLVTAGGGKHFERASLFPQNSLKLYCFIFC